MSKVTTILHSSIPIAALYDVCLHYHIEKKQQSQSYLCEQQHVSIQQDSISCHRVWITAKEKQLVYARQILKSSSCVWEGVQAGVSLKALEETLIQTLPTYHFILKSENLIFENQT